MGKCLSIILIPFDEHNTPVYCTKIIVFPAVFFHLQQLDKEQNVTNFEEKIRELHHFDIYFEFTTRKQEKDLGSIKMIISTQRNQQKTEL